MKQILPKIELFTRMSNDIRWVFSSLKVIKPLPNYMQISLVTAADESHSLSLEQLLDSINKFEPRANVYVYDLGLASKTLNKLIAKFPSYHFFPFPYSEFPDWMDIKVDAGNYAWKPQIVQMTANRIQAPFLWVDSGDKLFSDLKFMSRLIQAYGFYCPTSPGTLGEWTHPTTLRNLKVNPKLMGRHNLNAAIIGFDPRVKKVSQLINCWAENALNLEVIAPIGSNRSNHRQDQAVLGVLAHQMNLNPKGFKRHFSAKRMNILIHQDIERYCNSS